MPHLKLLRMKEKILSKKDDEGEGNAHLAGSL
jgi:hypothetical protein